MRFECFLPKRHEKKKPGCFKIQTRARYKKRAEVASRLRMAPPPHAPRSAACGTEVRAAGEALRAPPGRSVRRKPRGMATLERACCVFRGAWGGPPTRGLLEAVRRVWLRTFGGPGGPWRMGTPGAGQASGRLGLGSVGGLGTVLCFSLVLLPREKSPNQPYLLPR